MIDHNNIPNSHKDALRKAQLSELLNTRLPRVLGFAPNFGIFESIDPDGEIVLNSSFSICGLVFEGKDGNILKDDPVYNLRDMQWNPTTKSLTLLYGAEYGNIGLLTARFQFTLPYASYNTLIPNMFSFWDSASNSSMCPDSVPGLLSVRMGAPAPLTA